MWDENWEWWLIFLWRIPRIRPEEVCVCVLWSKVEKETVLVFQQRKEREKKSNQTSLLEDEGLCDWLCCFVFGVCENQNQSSSSAPNSHALLFFPFLYFALLLLFSLFLNLICVGSSWSSSCKPQYWQSCYLHKSLSLSLYPLHSNIEGGTVLKFLFLSTVNKKATCTVPQKKETSLFCIL